MLIKKMEEIPEKALEALTKFCIVEFSDDAIIESVAEIADIIQEAGEHKEKMDTWDLIHEWTLDIGDWKFITTGSQYIKDQCICDMKYDEQIEIIDVLAEKEAKKLAKAKKLEQKIADSAKKWETFFEGKTKEEIINNLMKCEFPNTL